MTEFQNGGANVAEVSGLRSIHHLKFFIFRTVGLACFPRRPETSATSIS